MKKSIAGIAAACAVAALSAGCAARTAPEEQAGAPEAAEAAAQGKPRTVITTDGEVDDMNSVIRALLYANEMDIAGIVLTSSVYHYAGDADRGVEPFRWTGTDWIFTYLDDYGKVYPNLSAHADGYPSADSLRAVTKIGNISGAGEMEEVTEGSEFLKELFLDDDPRTLYVQTWGGTNTTARALKSIEEEYRDTPGWQAVQDKLNRKLVLYIILDQDSSYADYIAPSWPGLTVINDRSNFWHFAYAWKFHDDGVNAALHADWSRENLLDKGPLMEHYALMGDGKTIGGELYEELRGTDDYLAAHPEYERYDFISEGDSPSFLYLAANGLRSYENPGWGGWGGRFGPDGERRWVNNALDYDPASGQFEAIYTLTRWFDDMQNDFAARADWCVSPAFADANHAPEVSVAEGLDVTAAPGAAVTLTAQASDPDGDALSYRWWRYAEADAYRDEKRELNAPEVVAAMGLQLNVTRTPLEGEPRNAVEISGADTARAAFTVPEDARSGDTFHIILEVQDDGRHMLKRYARVIVTVE